ncbi:GyrI-like domain-containing protein [Bacillus sp. IITD106]|nr:GyrI-like domain-containing protein [Bacillus sp. IITD106]
MQKLESKTLKTHDHRKIYREIYQLKPQKTVIQLLPELKYVSQSMVTSYDMEWDGRPEPKDEKWLAWKVVNQIKQITKKELEYKFKRMPEEIIWHEKADHDKWVVDQMILVADCVTEEMFDRAKKRVIKSLRVKDLPTITFKINGPTLCAQRLHVGHYKDTKETLQILKEDIDAQGYKIKGAHREIYLLPAMDCYPPEKCKTIVSVEIEKKENKN